LSEDSTDLAGDIAIARARDAAAAAIARGWARIPGADAADLVPVRIHEPTGEAAGWFVGLVDGERLIGFIQLGPDLAFGRASAFGGTGQAARDWLDADRVSEVAASVTRPGERLGEPYLSYDSSPDRIGWIVPLIDSDGGTRQLMVTGSSAFELRRSD
jgi:hypothetical protein